VRERPAPEVFPTGIAALDALTGIGGLPRSALTEICGPASSGRTSVLLSLLAQATARQEACALIDASDAFHPESAQAAGVELGRLLWVRCGSSSPPRAPGNAKEEQRLSPQRAQRNTKEEKDKIENQKYKVEPVAKSDFVKARPDSIGSDEQALRGSRFRKQDLDRLEQALKAADLLLQSGGFGLLVMDLADIAPEVARRVPLTSWFRFRRAVENTPTALVVLEQKPFARTCASLVVNLRHKRAQWSSLLEPEFYATAPPGLTCAAAPAHARLLGGLELEVDVTRSRVAAMRRPSGSVVPGFATRSAWRGKAI
jgi:hypothetical protein